MSDLVLASVRFPDGHTILVDCREFCALALTGREEVVLVNVMREMSRPLPEEV